MPRLLCVGLLGTVDLEGGRQVQRQVPVKVSRTLLSGFVYLPSMPEENWDMIVLRAQSLEKKKTSIAHPGTIFQLFRVCSSDSRHPSDSRRPSELRGAPPALAAQTSSKSSQAQYRRVPNGPLLLVLWCCGPQLVTLQVYLKVDQWSWLVQLPEPRPLTMTTLAASESTQERRHVQRGLR